MAVKNFEQIDVNNDVTTTRTLLHEAIPLTGAIISSGTYNNDNIKNFTHGMFQSVYDYPYLSSSANHIFDIAACYAASSSLSASTNTQNAKKINMYTEFAQSLLGFTGSLTDPANQVRLFENDLTLDGGGGDVMDSVFILNFSRLLTKDQIKKGTFSITLGTGAFGSAFTNTLTLADSDASTDGTGVASALGGDYGLLMNSGSKVYGNIFYQAGIAIISGSAFDGSGVVAGASTFYAGAGNSGSHSFNAALTASTISGTCDAVRQRIQNLSFNNTTEINSKIYFCRVPHNKFNYSSNPTYLSGSKIKVKNNSSDQPVAYITTIGLYNSSNELLAVAKLSEPIRKDPTNDITLRVRLDY